MVILVDPDKVFCGSDQEVPIYSVTGWLETYTELEWGINNKYLKDCFLSLYLYYKETNMMLILTNPIAG